MKADIRSCHFHLLGVPVLSLDAVWEPSGTRIGNNSPSPDMFIVPISVGKALQTQCPRCG
jgi:hypothetical protein